MRFIGMGGEGIVKRPYRPLPKDVDVNGQVPFTVHTSFLPPSQCTLSTYSITYPLLDILPLFNHMINHVT